MYRAQVPGRGFLGPQPQTQPPTTGPVATGDGGTYATFIAHVMPQHALWPTDVLGLAGGPFTIPGAEARKK